MVAKVHLYSSKLRDTIGVPKSLSISLLKFFDEITTTIVDIIYLGFQKAFDKVPWYKIPNSKFDMYVIK